MKNRDNRRANFLTHTVVSPRCEYAMVQDKRCILHPPDFEGMGRD